MYTYYATVRAVHDGDTVTVDIDQGFNDWKHNQHLRIAGISARELSMPGGPEAAAYLRSILIPGLRVKIQSHKLDHDMAEAMSFDRYVADIQLSDGTDLALLLVRDGWAVPWDGKTKPTPYVEWSKVTPITL